MKRLYFSKDQKIFLAFINHTYNINIFLISKQHSCKTYKSIVNLKITVIEHIIYICENEKI